MPAAAPKTMSREGLAALKQKINRLKILETKEDCQDSLRFFVEQAWPHVDPSPFMANWAIDAVCFPYSTKIITSDGEKSIGDVVEYKWQGDILSFNHDKKQLEWKPLISHMKSPSAQLLRINDNLLLTDNHPVYVVGKGYTKAVDLTIGDEIVTTTEFDKLSPVRQAALCAPFPEKGIRILLNGLLQQIKSKTRCLHLSNLRREKGLGWGSMSQVHGIEQQTRTSASLYLLRKSCLEIARRAYTNAKAAWRILQSEMFWFSNARREASSVYQWQQHSILSSRLLVSEAFSFETRWGQMLSLLKHEVVRNSSYRSGQGKQRIAKFGSPMQALSFRPTRAHVKKFGSTTGYQTGTTVINTIERDTWVPDAVYNIEVLDNHNYFAQSVLVHNCDHLEGVMLGQIPRLLINIPPRCSKTTIVSIMFPAWVWLRYGKELEGPLSGPQVRFLCASYSDKLSLLSSNAFRRLVKSEWYSALYPELKFMRDQDAKGHMDNNKRGSRQSTSVGGSLLGLGGDILIADDLNNTETEKLVETGAERNKTASFFDEFRSTRKNDPRDGHSALIGVQQRTHEEDMSGHWASSEEEITHLIIPMRHDPAIHCRTVVLPQYDDDIPWEDPRDPDGDDLMWPERFGEKQVLGLEKALGPIMAAGRLQQQPKAKGGNIIQRNWWQLWGADEARNYGLVWEDKGLKEYPTFELMVASLDTAQKEKEENDFNALTIWGIFLDAARNRRAMLVHGWQKRLPLNGREVDKLPNELPINFERRKKEHWGLVQWVASSCRYWKVKRLLIEDKTRGHDVAQEIKRQFTRDNWGVQLLNPVGDKISRAHSVVPLFADGSVFAPEFAWSEMVIDQCVVAGTKIITANGLIPVEKIGVGDLILTHRGRFRPVLRTFKRSAKKFVKVQGKSIDALTITPEHPFYAAHLNSKGQVDCLSTWVKAQEIQARQYKEIVRNGKTYNEAYPSPSHAVTLPLIQREQPVEKLDLREWALLPTGKKYEFLENDTHMTTSHHAMHEMRWEQLLDERFGRFLGLFLAEGCARRSSVSWSFNKKEQNLVDEIVTFIKERFDIHATFNYFGEGSVTVNACIPLLESFFQEFGTYSYNKKIPQWVWNAPDSFIQGLLSGWFDGDGSFLKGTDGSIRGLSGVTSSISLAWGIRLLLLRLGKRPTIYSNYNEKDAVFGDRIYKSRPSHTVSYLFNPKNDGAVKFTENLAAFSVMKTESFEEEQDVFNFEVAEDNSYCTTGGCVHNCEGFPKKTHDDLVDSVTQFLNWARDNDILIMTDEYGAMMEDMLTHKHHQTSVAEQYGV